MPLQLSSPSFYDSGSRPEDADRGVVQLQAGDVVVAGSDGLWDNLWERRLVEVVAQEQEEVRARGCCGWGRVFASRPASAEGSVWGAVGWRQAVSNHAGGASQLPVAPFRPLPAGQRRGAG